MPGDYEGIGKSDLAVFRPATDQWIIRLSSGAPRSPVRRPEAGRHPRPRRLRGDGKTDLAIFRPATDQWIIRYSSGGGEVVQFGDPADHDMPAPGDYDGDGKTDLAVFRPGIDDGSSGSPGGARICPFGDPTQHDIPVPGDYNGDGTADLAVYRPSTAQWFIEYSGGGGENTQYGDPKSGDLPAGYPVNSVPLGTFGPYPYLTVVPVPAGPLTASRGFIKKWD